MVGVRRQPRLQEGEIPRVLVALIAVVPDVVDGNVAGGDPQPVASIAVSEPEPPVEAAMAMETKQKEAAPAPAAAEKPKRTAKRQKPRPTRSAKVRRNPRRDYAYQPFFWGGYRPWW